MPIYDKLLCSRTRAVALLSALLVANTFAAPTPKPFTPVKASLNEFRCLGRKTEFGDFLLPKQIVAADKPLLASPVHVFSEPDFFSSVKGQSKVVSCDGDSAQWEWTAETQDFSLSSKMKGDCDGFCWYEIQLTPKHPVKVRSLGLEIPRVASTARYLHTSEYDWSNVSQGLPELGGKWSGHFMPYVWLGDEDRGLAWCAESDEGYRLSDAGHATQVTTQGNMVSVKMTVIDHEETVSKPIVLRFGLQASPVRPISFARRAKARILHDIHYDSCKPGADGRCELDKIKEGGAKTVVIHDSWTKYFGQMTPADDGQMRALIKACHERGLRLLVYVGYGIARTAPELQGKHDLWSAVPLIPWNPGYKPETRGFDATCPRSGWAEWLVDGVDKLFSNYDLDGLYFDGVSEAWLCQNEAHGCGWRDEKGNLHPVHPMLAARQLMRHIADTVRRHKPDAILDVHMSSNLTLPTLAFCDSLWNGEQFEVHTAAEKFQVPLPFFRTEFMGYAHGMDMEFLCYENRPFTFDEAITLAWLHGIEVRPYPGNLWHVTPIWRAMDKFGVAKAKWQPYWKDSGARADSEVVKSSAWTRDGKALLFVSHLDRVPATAQIHLDAKRLGVKRGTLVARDAMTGEAIPVNGDAMELKFTGMNYRMIEVSRQ